MSLVFREIILDGLTLIGFVMQAAKIRQECLIGSLIYLMTSLADGCPPRPTTALTGDMPQYINNDTKLGTYDIPLGIRK